MFLEIFVAEFFNISKVTEYSIFEYDVCEKHESKELGKIHYYDFSWRL